MEVAFKLNQNKFDFVTFVGSGEPTLYKDLNYLIAKAKVLSEKPVCVITNGSLLYNNDVQNALINSDVVLPSLDAGDEKSFIQINRPHPSIEFEKMIQGLIDFRMKFAGKFWIEVMLMKGINDNKEELLKIKEKLDEVKPDRIDINVPIRPPLEKWVKIPEMHLITKLNEIFKDYTNINYPEKGLFSVYSQDFEKEILSIIERHPMREEQIIEIFTSTSNEKITLQLKKLESEKKIKKIFYNDKTFWKLNLN